MAWVGTGTLASRAAELRPVFEAVGAQEGVPWGLLMGIAEIESGFQRDIVNAATGAAGLMQLMSAYPARDLHFKAAGWTYPHTFEPIRAGVVRGVGGTGWNNPTANIRAGARVLLWQMRHRGDDLRRALSGYGGHSGAPPDVPYVDKVLAAAERYGFRPHYALVPAPTGTGVTVVPVPQLAQITPISFEIVRDVPALPPRLLPAVQTAAPWLFLLALLGAAAARRN